MKVRRWMKNELRIGQRWRRNRDGVVIVIAQVHRVDRMCECYYEQALEETDMPRRFGLDFTVLRSDHQVLCSMEAAA